MWLGARGRIELQFEFESEQEDCDADIVKVVTEKVKDARAMVEFLKSHEAKGSSGTDGNKRLDGKWRTGRDKNVTRIEDAFGYVVLSEFDVEAALIIDTFDGSALSGAQKLEGGQWRDVVGTLKDGVLHMKGGGLAWTMTKLPDASSE